MRASRQVESRLSAAQARKIVSRFPGQVVGVVGDLMLDELIQGTAGRISPEAPVPVVLLPEKSRPELFPGGAGNVVANLAALGARPLPVGVVGRDQTGRQVLELLARSCPDSQAVIQENHRVTPRKIRIVAHQQQLLRVDHEAPKPLAQQSAFELRRALERILPSMKALVVSDYNKGTVSAELHSWILAKAREKKIPTFVDLKPENAAGCRGATLVAPNAQEAERMTGLTLRDRASLEEAGRRLLAQLDCSYLLVTRGGEGMSLFETQGDVLHIPAATRPVYDVTGAGDTVMATLSLAYCSGATMKEAALLANLAGLMAVLKFGTAQITRDELMKAISPTQGSQRRKR